MPALQLTSIERPISSTDGWRALIAPCTSQR
jgi:hypothetical protein